MYSYNSNIQLNQLTNITNVSYSTFSESTWGSVIFNGTNPIVTVTISNLLLKAILLNY